MAIEQMPIDQILGNMITLLETRVSKDPAVGKELAFNVRDFHREYEKTIREIRGCQNITQNMEKIVSAFIPQGKKLAQSVWQTFEAYGLWDPNTEGLSNQLTEALTQERFINDAIDGILMGCECHKKA